jgi:hypothetical protein
VSLCGGCGGCRNREKRLENKRLDRSRALCDSRACDVTGTNEQERHAGMGMLHDYRVTPSYQCYVGIANWHTVSGMPPIPIILVGKCNLWLWEPASGRGFESPCTYCIETRSTVCRPSVIVATDTTVCGNRVK